MKLQYLHEDQYDDLMGDKHLPDQDQYLRIGSVGVSHEFANDIQEWLNDSGIHPAIEKVPWIDPNNQGTETGKWQRKIRLLDSTNSDITDQILAGAWGTERPNNVEWYVYFDYAGRYQTVVIVTHYERGDIGNRAGGPVVFDWDDKSKAWDSNW